MNGPNYSRQMNHHGTVNHRLATTTFPMTVREVKRWVRTKYPNASVTEWARLYEQFIRT